MVTSDDRIRERATQGPTDPTSRLFAMARLLDSDVSDRKRRQFAVACLSRFESGLEDPRSRRALETAARLVTGDATEDDRARAESDAFEAHAELREARFGGESLVPWSYRGDLLSRAASLVVSQGLYYAEDAADYALRTLTQEAEEAELAVQVHLLHELLGPHPRPRIDPGWLVANDSAVAHLARCIESDGSFDLMPILADALEDAGCGAGPILEHCRSAGPHAPGCWVIDALLGKP